MTKTSPVTEIRQRVDAAVARAAGDPSLALQPRDITPVTEAVVAGVAPTVLHLTNNEPWYQSRVTIGAIVSIAVPLLGLAGISADVVDAEEITAVLVAIGTAVGGILTLYGRWKAKTPIGS